MERFSLSKGADSDKAAKARLKGIDKQLKQLKDEQKVIFGVVSGVDPRCRE